MRKQRKTVKVIISLIIFLILRYHSIYFAIDSDNSFLLNLASKYNFMINLRPVPDWFRINGIDYNETPLVYAIKRDKYNSVKVLLNNGADPNAVYGWKENFGMPLEYCLRYGGKNRYKIAKLLKEKGADFFKNRHFILYLIEHKCFDDDEETLKYKYELFLEWMNKFHTDNEYDFYIAYYAVNGNSLNEFMYMMENYDIDINLKEDAGFYILSLAAQNRNVEFFKLLIDYGANVDFITKNGLTIENFITDERYDEKLINGKYETINYDSEKEEMLRIVNDVRKKNNLSKNNN